MAKENKPQKKKKGRSVQDLMGIKTFTKYGLATNKGELLFYLVSPTNISVLSAVNIEIKVRHLMMVLSAIPDIEITCTDSSECFDDNKAYLQGRLAEENNPKVRRLLKKDMDFLDSIQVEMATARQFLFIARCQGLKAGAGLPKCQPYREDHLRAGLRGEAYEESGHQTLPCSVLRRLDERRAYARCRRRTVL